jgi:undecaprenyl diphosphate synthase
MQSEPAPGLHVALIMDGNGRWATQRGLPRVAGHRAGVAAARGVVERASEIGIRRLTLYAFSSDNWRRPMPEVQRIFRLLRAFLRLEQHRCRRRGARLEVIGRRDRLPAALVEAIEQAERVTAGGCRIHVRVAVDYSSREAIARAAACSRDNSAEALFAALTASTSNVDLLIRTGGEQRLSDFLLWESAYAELLFTSRMWPDFTGEHLEAALKDFRQRERRFGGLTTS